MSVSSIFGTKPAASPEEKRRVRRRKRARSLHVGDRGSRLERAARGLLAFGIVGSVLAIGSVHAPVAIIASMILVATGAITLWSRSATANRVPPPALLLIALAVYTALQAMPISLAWLTHFDPSSADIWRRASAAIGGREPHWVALSLDPGASWLQALEWLAYAGTFIAAARVGVRRGARWGAALLLVSAGLVAATTIAHGAVDATTVFGFYTPRFGGDRWHMGPLVDPNNLAGYLNLGALAGLGLLAEETPPAPRWVIALSAAPVVGASFISESRGGFGALIGGLVLLALLFRKAQGVAAGLGARRTMLSVLAATVGGISLALVGANRETFEALLSKDIQKINALAYTVPMMKDHLWFGVGRGAFQSVFQQYFVSPGDVVYSHPENFAVQWATEWGVPAAAFGLCGTAWLLRPRRLGYLDSPAAAGTFAGLVALVAQNVVDLSLEVPGVMFAAVGAAGFLWGGASAKYANGEARHARQRTAALALAFLGVCLALAASIRGTQTVLADRDDVVIDFPKKPQELPLYSAYRDQLLGAISRHPAEPFFSRMGAILAWNGKHESPLPWMVLALERAPTSGRTNYLLGLYLAQRGFRNQALMELRMGADYDAGLAPHVAAVALVMTRDPPVLRRVVPDGLNGAPVLYELARKLPSEMARERDEFLHDAAVHDPNYSAARALAAERLLSAMENPDGTGRCIGGDAPRCAKEIVGHADALARLMPRSEESVVIRGRLFIVLGRPRIAAESLATECRDFNKKYQCLLVSVEAAAATHDPKLSAVAANEFAVNGCTGQTHCANAYATVGTILTKAGDGVAGLTYFERAARENPVPVRWRRAADAATTIADGLISKGDTPGAIAFYERAAKEDPNVVRWRRLAEVKEPHENPPPNTGLDPKAVPLEIHQAVQQARVNARPAPGNH